MCVFVYMVLGDVCVCVGVFTSRFSWKLKA